MTIALVQKTVQQFYNGVTIASRTITGVTAGNLLTATVACASVANTSPVPALPTPTGWTAAIAPTGSTGIDAYRGICAIYYKENAASGSHTIDFSGGAALPTDSYAEITIEEWSGIVTAGALDVVSNSALATPQTAGTSGTTAATAVATSVHIAVGVPGGGSQSALSSPATTGYTAIDTSASNAVNTAYDASYKILSATGAQTASWTWTGNGAWCGVGAVFKGTTASTWDRAETAAGIEAADRTLALAADRAETTAGTTAQDRTVPLSAAAAETSAGTEAQDRTLALTFTATETSAGTEAQDRTLAVTAAAAETSAGTEAQDRTLALARDAAETSASTTAQDFTAGIILNVPETSAGTTAQDRSIATIARDVQESSAGTTSQSFLAPAGSGQSALRRTLEQIYTDYFAEREKQLLKSKEPQKQPAVAPKLQMRARGPQRRAEALPETDLEAAVRLASAALFSQSQTRARLKLLERSIIKHPTTAPAVQTAPVEQADDEDEDLLLLASVL